MMWLSRPLLLRFQIPDFNVELAIRDQFLDTWSYHCPSRGDVRGATGVIIVCFRPDASPTSSCTPIAANLKRLNELPGHQSILQKMNAECVVISY